MKKTLALLMALALVISAIALPALAENNTVDQTTSATMQTARGGRGGKGQMPGQNNRNSQMPQMPNQNGQNAQPPQMPDQSGQNGQQLLQREDDQLTELGFVIDLVNQIHRGDLLIIFRRVL